MKLPDRVYVHTDAYGERLGMSLKPLPAGPRLIGQEAEYVRVDLAEPGKPASDEERT